MSNLKEKAMEAYKKQQTENTQAEERKQKEKIEFTKKLSQKTKEQFESDFGVIIDLDWVDGHVIQFENCTIYQAGDNYDRRNKVWRIIKNCVNTIKNDDPEAHANITSGWFQDLAKLGEFLECFKDNNLCWSCRNQSTEKFHPTPTTEEEFIAVFKKMISENTY